MDPSSSFYNRAAPAESIPHHADAAAGRSKGPVLSTSTVSDPLAQINSTLIETMLLTEMGRIQDKSSPESPFQNCSATSNAKIHIHTNIEDNDTYGNMAHDGSGDASGSTIMWILQALTKDGERKTDGGDEFYITYTGNNAILANSTINDTIDEGDQNNPAAVAIVTDLNDGTCGLKFKTTHFNRHPLNLTGMGLLAINLQFTCGIGSMPHPSKSNWTSAGRTNRKLTVENVLSHHCNILFNLLFLISRNTRWFFSFEIL